MGQRREVAQVLSAGDLPGEAAVTAQHQADAPHLSRIMFDVIAEHTRRDTRGGEQGGPYGHGGLLAGTVRAE